MQKVFDFLEQNDANGLDFAISHNLYVPVCDMVLVGMKNPKYVESTVSSVSKLIDEKIVAEAKEILLKELEAQKG